MKNSVPFFLFRVVACGLMLTAPLCAKSFARPVLVELFTTSRVSSARSAEQAVARLQVEYATGEFHLLVYQLNDEDPDWSFEGAIRAMEYGVKTDRLPIAVFNGTSRIEGSKPDLYPYYRDQFVQKQARPEQGKIDSWFHLSAESTVSYATYQLHAAEPAPQYEVFFALAENRSEDRPGVARSFELIVDATDALSGEASVRLDRPVALSEIKTSAIWWLQDVKTKEILHSHQSASLAPLRWDANGDGEWDGRDAFWLPYLWRTNSTAADADRDGLVSQPDLLYFILPSH